LSESRNKTFEAIIKAIKEHGKVLIAGHHNPDGDCIGACFAMALVFAGMGVEPVILLEPFAENYNFLDGAEYVYKGDISAVDGGAMLCLDCATRDRLGDFEPLLDQAEFTAVIDHHISEKPPFAQLNIIDGKAAATCEILCELLSGIGVEITRSAAAALYAGIVFDSGCFRHTSTTPRTYEIAASLLETGIDFNLIQRKIMYEHSPTQAKAFAAAILGMRIVPELNFAITGLTHSQMSDIGAVSTDLEGIVEYMLNTRGVEIAALLSERNPGTVTISFRSIKLNVRGIANALGGGGHIHAAGCKQSGTVDEAAETVIKAVKEARG
jgi:phosphoesterase RecJ-like protein